MPIYIGQVLFEDKLIPGKIHHGTNQIHIEYDVTVHTINETIKVSISLVLFNLLL